MTHPSTELEWLFEDAITRGREDFRERLAKALHDLTCSCAIAPEPDEPYLYDPIPGGENMYQRRADDLIALVESGWKPPSP
jgi:hypothetical protein